MRGPFARHLRVARLLSVGLFSLGGGLTILGGIIRWWGTLMDLLSFSDDMESLIAAVSRFEADWGLYILLVGLVGLIITFVIPVWKSRSQKAIGTEGQGINSGLVLPEVGTKAPQLDRQPINQAYAYLVGLKVAQEDGTEPLHMHIAGLLRQAALDGDIMIWGAEPSLVPVERQTPILLAIDRDFLRHHGIDPVCLTFDASALPDEGCKTQREGRPSDDKTECYWHLHVDMNQVWSIWRQHTRPDNE